jgi:hypothetical protein
MSNPARCRDAVPGGPAGNERNERLYEPGITFCYLVARVTKRRATAMRDRWRPGEPGRIKDLR